MASEDGAVSVALQGHRTDEWPASSVFATRLEASDRNRFPPGSVTFDCALLMERVAHEWIPLAPLCAEGEPQERRWPNATGAGAPLVPSTTAFFARQRTQVPNTKKG